MCINRDWWHAGIEDEDFEVRGGSGGDAPAADQLATAGEPDSR